MTQHLVFMRSLPVFLALLTFGSAPLAIAQASPTADAAPTWLKCDWTVKTSSLAEKGLASRAANTSDTRSIVFRFTPGSRQKFEQYDSARQSLDYLSDAAIGSDVIVMQLKQDYTGPDGKFNTHIENMRTIDRKTLEISEVGQSTMRDDKFDSTVQSNTVGRGTCALIEPLPLSPITPNQF